ncbi:hypothetical protein PoB_005714400 [Plakobranchus ocellatus]|uniref:Uncharacterized protein n=1 Tax=Plakobranchus ocellatus TaxID=259542 RepID=A0AAV4CHG5_9GAST|nr:hypothetical protein PoB_005714400 [Plakobranchus ocellatus]
MKTQVQKRKACCIRRNGYNCYAKYQATWTSERSQENRVDVRITRPILHLETRYTDWAEKKSEGNQPGSVQASEDSRRLSHTSVREQDRAAFHRSARLKNFCMRKSTNFLYAHDSQFQILQIWTRFHILMQPGCGGLPLTPDLASSRPDPTFRRGLVRPELADFPDGFDSVSKGCGGDADGGGNDGDDEEKDRDIDSGSDDDDDDDDDHDERYNYCCGDHDHHDRCC